MNLSALVARHLSVFLCSLLFWLPLGTGIHAADWLYFGGDAGGRHYSALAHINRHTVQQLQPAWSYQTGELARFPEQKPFASFHATPRPIGHLRRHSAGLPDHVHLPEFQAAWARIAAGEGTLTPEDLVGFATGQEPLFEAGTA